MTRNEMLEKCLRLKDDASRIVEKKIEQALKSGALDLDSPYADVFPKAVVCACLESTADDFRPLTQTGLTELKNLRHFI